MAFNLPFTQLHDAGLGLGLDAQSIGIATTRNAHFVQCNKSFAGFFDKTADQLQGQHASCIFPSIDDFESFLSLAYERAQSPDEAFTINWRFRRPNRNDLVCRVRAQILHRSKDDSSTLWIFEDMGPAIERAQAFEQSMERLGAMMHNAPTGIFVTVNRQVVNVNPAFCRIFDYSAAQALGLRGRDLLPSDQAYADLGQAVTPLLSNAMPFQCETEMVRSDGGVFWAHLVAYVVNKAQTNEGTIWMVTDRSAEKRNETSLRKSLQENQIILDSAAVGIVFLKNRVVQRCNPHAERIFGHPPGQMVGTSTRLWYGSDGEFENVAQTVYPALVSGQTYTFERNLVRADGSTFWCQMAGQVLDPENPITGPSIWVLHDLSALHDREQELSGARAMLQAVFDSAKVSIVVTAPDGIIRMVNPTACAWLGYEAADLIGQVTPRVFHDTQEIERYAEELTAQLGRPADPYLGAVVMKAHQEGSDEREWTYIRRDGSRFPVQLTTSVLRDTAGRVSGYMGVATDATDRKRAEDAMRAAQIHLEERVAARTAELERANLQLQKEIQHRRAVEDKMRRMAHFDALTGLPNRLLLSGSLEKAIALAKRKPSVVGLMFIDLDGFKHTNDTLGHDVGDGLLRGAAERMSAVVRESDTLARHGGDEFVLLIPEVKETQDLTELANRLLDAFATPFTVMGHDLRTTPSIGIACYPTDSNDANGLLRCADSAMYQAKMAGKNRFAFYQPAQD